MPPAASTTFITSPTADLLASFANDRLVVELVFPNAAGAAPLRGLVLWPAADEGGELSDAWRFIVWGTSSKTPASASNGPHRQARGLMPSTGPLGSFSGSAPGSGGIA